MTREDAIAIIRKEYQCVDRDCDIERSCGKCDLVMPSKEPILQAYNMAISALSQPQIPDNATNGDVIKAMFDVTEEHFYDEDRMVDVYGLDRTDDPSTFYADWWNSPYKAESKPQESEEEK